MAPENLSFYQNFFEESLFLIPENGPAPAGAAEAQVAYSPGEGDTMPKAKYHLLGANRKGLILAVSVDEKEFAELPANVFLSKVLTAIQYNLDDVAFVNLQRGEKLDVFNLTKETTVKHLIAFGPGLLDMESDGKIHLYKPAGIGQVPLLIADPLAAIEPDVSRKKALWVALQTIFMK